jgi:hypothetical protein
MTFVEEDIGTVFISFPELCCRKEFFVRVDVHLMLEIDH